MVDPSISVIIPAFNAVRYLPEAIESIGRFPGFLAAAAVSVPERLERQLGQLQTRQGAAACFTDYWRFDSRSGRVGHRAPRAPLPTYPVRYLNNCPLLVVQRWWIGLSPLGRQRRATAVCFVVLCAYFFASWETRPLFFSNQNTYFLQGLRRAGVDGLQADWLSHTRSPHLAFTWVVAALQSLEVLQLGVRLIEVALYLGLLWALWVLSGCHNSRRPVRSPFLRFLICALFLSLLTEPGPWHQAFNWGGLAQQYLFGGYLQPSEFGIAILIAIALLSVERHRLSIGFLVLAATFHASYLIPCTLLTLLISADLVYRNRTREGVLLLAVFVSGVSPVVVYGLSFGGDATSTARASALLAREIIPQHAWPAVWLSRDQLVRTLIMTAGSVVAWRYHCRAVALAMTGSLPLIVLGTTYVYFSENTYIALLFPWRASVYLYPLSLFCLVVSMVMVATRLTDHIGPRNMETACRWCALVVGTMLMFESARELAMPKSAPQFPFAAEVSELSHVNDQIIIPVTDRDLWNRFRLLTLRPIYVDHKSHPYLAAEVLEWKRRVDAVEDFYLLAPEQRQRRCREMGASFHVAVSEEATDTAGGSGKPVLSLVGCV